MVFTLICLTLTIFQAHTGYWTHQKPSFTLSITIKIPLSMLKRLLSILPFFWLLLTHSALIHAQYTGEIQGVVKDAETGEVLPVATVSIDIGGNLIGTTSDFDGFYSITSIPVGKYSVTFSYVGLDVKTIGNVIVERDVTTNLSTELTSSVQTTIPEIGVPKVPSPALGIQESFGEIQGKVTDTETGEALPFVNISLDIGGILVGTTTDFDGVYSVSPVRPRVYDVTFSFVGMKSKVVEQAQVHSDKTTQINTELKGDTKLNSYPFSSGGCIPLLDSGETRTGVVITRTRLGRFDVRNIY